MEIAFLANHGVSVEALIRSARRAQRLGTAPEREIILAGLVDEAGFYRRLAAELGLTFVDETLALRPGGDYDVILREGMAPIAPGGHDLLGFAIAPQGYVLRRVLEAGPRHRDHIAVTTPSLFAESLRAANATPLSRRLAGDVAECMARPSAREPLSRGQRVALGLATVTVAVGGIWAPLPTFFTLAAAAGPLFLLLILLRVGTSFEKRECSRAAARRTRIDPSRLPVYTVAVPLFREEAVLRQITASLSALDYPLAKLDIKLLIEEDDAGLRRALHHLSLPPSFSVCIVPRGQPRTKPRALNLALAEASGSLFTIFDAEDIPDPQQLRTAAARFLRAPPELACLQARLVIDDHPGAGPLPAFFALEYAALFEVLNPGLMIGGLPILLGGTSNHFRTEALRAVGGWDAWNVTEDADLAVRLVRAGYRMGDLPSETREEAPLTLRAWLKQRARWLKGYMQTIMTHSREPLVLLREAGFSASLTFLTLALGTVLSALGYPIFAVATYLSVRESSFLASSGLFPSLLWGLAFLVWVLGYVGLALPAIVGALRQRRPQLLLLVPLLPLYYVLVSAAAWLAVYEFIARPHVWNKTAHGLARRREPMTATVASATPPRPRPEASRY